MKYIGFLLIILPHLLFAQKQREAYLDSLLSVLPKAKEDTHKVDILNTITAIYIEKISRESADYALQSVSLSEKTDYKKGLATANHNLGIIYQATSDFSRALECFLKALKISEELGRKNAIVANLNGVGSIYRDQGNHAKALEYYFKAVKINQEIQDKWGLGDCFDLIASTYSQQGKHSEAIKYHFKALGIFEQTGDRMSVAVVLTNLGDDYHGEKKYYTALECYLKALSINNRIQNYYGAEINIGDIGKNYLALAKDPDFALADDQTHTAQKEALHKAVTFLDSAVGTAKRIGDYYYLQYFSKYLCEANEMLGNHKAALAAYKDHAFYKDSVFSKTSKEKITALENQRELDLKENKIKLLEQENKVKNLQAEKEKLTRKVLLGGVAMIFIVASFVIIYIARRQKTEKQIANEKVNTLLKEQELKSVSNMLDVQESERKRIATDLHDRLGSMLSTVKLYFGQVEEQVDKLKEQNKEQYTKATSLLDEACDEVRKISHDLVSGELVKFGLVPALEQLAETIEHTGQLKIKVLSFGMNERLDSAIEIALYRIVQELMNNILRHSKATEVIIQLTLLDKELNVVVEDNGIGFDINIARAKGGLGLQSVVSRVSKLNGKVNFDSGKGKGTTVIIDIPA